MMGLYKNTLLDEIRFKVGENSLIFKKNIQTNIIFATKISNKSELV